MIRVICLPEIKKETFHVRSWNLLHSLKKFDLYKCIIYIFLTFLSLLPKQLQNRREDIVQKGESNVWDCERSNREIRNSDSVEIRLSMSSLPIIRESARKGSRARSLLRPTYARNVANLQFCVAIEIDIRLPLSRVSLDYSFGVDRKGNASRRIPAVAKPRDPQPLRSKHAIMPPEGRLISVARARFSGREPVDDLLPAFTAIFFSSHGNVSSDLP